MPPFTFVASRCRCSCGARAASQRRFVRSCRGGSRSCSATCPSPAGCGGHAIQPGVTEPTLALGRGQARWPVRLAPPNPLPTRQMSARFRPRTIWEAGLRPDSSALHPLHSISLQFRRLHFRSIAFRRSQTGETVRRQIVRARMMAGAARTGRETSSGQGISNTARGFACRRRQSNSTAMLRTGRWVQAMPANNREHGHFPNATLR